jgi:hypothetical protein
MIMPNEHSQAIPEHVLNEVQTRVNESLNLLKPYVVYSFR